MSPLHCLTNEGSEILSFMLHSVHYWTLRSVLLYFFTWVLKDVMPEVLDRLRELVMGYGDIDF